MAKYKLFTNTRFSKDSDGHAVQTIVEAGVTLDAGNGLKYDIPINPELPMWQDYLAWKAEGNTPEAADSPTDWDLARQKRDTLLKDSDWTMITGATVDQAQWSAYREKLRDIPQTYKGKETSEIVWPAAPSTKGPNS